MVDPTKKLNWSSVDVEKALSKTEELIAHTKKSAELLEKMALLFRVVILFPDIKEENKAFHLMGTGSEYSPYNQWLVVNGEHRKLTRKQYEYIQKGKRDAYDDAARQRARQDNQRGAEPDPIKPLNSGQTNT